MKEAVLFISVCLEVWEAVFNVFFIMRLEFVYIVVFLWRGGVVSLTRELRSGMGEYVGT